MSLDALKPEPLKDSVTFESSPPGAQAKTSSGETCTTPCSLSLPTSGPLSVTFTLAGYAPETEQIELVAMGDGSNRLQPNPVSVELTAAPAAARKPAPATTKKKPAPKKPTAAAPAAQPAAAAAPAATTAAAPASPWPTSTQQPAR